MELIMVFLKWLETADLMLGFIVIMTIQVSALISILIAYDETIKFLNKNFNCLVSRIEFVLEDY